MCKMMGKLPPWCWEAWAACGGRKGSWQRLCYFEFFCLFSPEQVSGFSVPWFLCQWQCLRLSLFCVSFLWTVFPIPSTRSREIFPNEQFHSGHPLSRNSSPLPPWAAVSQLSSASSSKLLRTCFPPIPSASHLFFGHKSWIFSLAHKLISFLLLWVFGQVLPLLVCFPFPAVSCCHLGLGLAAPAHNLTPSDLAGLELHPRT